MTDEKRTEIANWLVKSQHDLGSAVRLLEGDQPYLDTAVYHCQQAVEKVLKAFLTFHDEEFQKTHDLTELLAACIRIEPLFLSRQADAQELTPYAVVFRYPGDVLEPEAEEAKRALAIAQDFVDFTLTLVPPETRPNKSC